LKWLLVVQVRVEMGIPTMAAVPVRLVDCLDLVQLALGSLLTVAKVANV
jgi:hypothetical protein